MGNVVQFFSNMAAPGWVVWEYPSRFSVLEWENLAKERALVCWEPLLSQGGDLWYFLLVGTKAAYLRFPLLPFPVSCFCRMSFGPHQGEEGLSVGSRVSVRWVVLLEFEVHVLPWCLCQSFWRVWRQAIVIWGVLVCGVSLSFSDSCQCSDESVAGGLLLLLLSRFSRVRLCATPQTAAHQTPPSLGFSRQEHWSGLPYLPMPFFWIIPETLVLFVVWANSFGWFHLANIYCVLSECQTLKFCAFN